MLVKLQAKIENDAGVEATRYVTQFVCTDENIPNHIRNLVIILHLA